jgi:polyisoprenoid-binding protein YceI
VTQDATTPEPESVAEPARRSRVRWYVFGTLGFLALAGIVAGVYAWTQYRTLTSSKYQVVNYKVPTAPHLVAGTGETVYRIDPTHSEVKYAIGEKLFGRERHTAVGATNGIAGEIALNESQPDASRVGQIVVNVEQLHSDNNLRDAKMRESNLNSHEYPLAQLTVSELDGLLKSQLIVQNTPAAVTWRAHASVLDGRLVATATADVKLSTWNIGPISISGLVSTSDDVTLTMKLTALDPSKHSVPTTIAPPDSAPRPKGDSPSFETVVMPLLRSNCASCHEHGEVGAAHWTLETAGDAADISDGIGAIVEAGYMPPWPASPKGVPLAHSRALDQDSIDAIVKWAKAGGQLDVDRDTPVTPLPGPVGPPPRHDVTMRMPEGYAGTLSVPNDYRCFVLDPHITKPTYVTGFEVVPDKRAEIHHVQIFHVSAAEAETARSMSGKDGKPGFSCYGTVSLPTSPEERRNRDPDSPRARARQRLRGFTGQAGLFAGWVPGQDPVTYPKNLGVEFEAGDAIVFQVHYHYDTTPVPDRSSVALQLDDPTPAFKPVDIINPIAPVEIPCMPGETAPLCNRDNALAEAQRLYGPAGSFVEPGLLALCGKSVEDLASTFDDGIASSTCDYTVPEDGTIISVFGHEHTLGKNFRLTLDPGLPTEKVLLDIPAWNFDWQMNYGLAKPIHVTQGQTIRMDCAWDRSIEPNRAPKYIVFAEGTEDEMCFGTYSLVPDKP